MTPGPWKWVEERGGVYRLIGADGTVVADDGSAWGEYGGWMNSPDEPNARLIAAAPDLLEAIQGFRRQLKIYASVYLWDKEVHRLLDECDAAIAKARGEK
jgi:hypothetical protein